MDGLKVGMPVSIDRDGNAFPGAGITIYRNISIDTINKKMTNAKIRELSFNVAMVVYDGGIDAYRFSFEGYAVSFNHLDLTPSLKGEVRRIDDVVRVSRERFIIVGNRELLPITARTTFANRQIKVEFFQGTPMALENDDDMWPHVDNLNNETFALVYENGDKLYTRVGHWLGDGNTSSLQLDVETLATNRYEYHGVAGMDDSHFIIAATGRQFGVNGSFPIVTACLCTVQPNKTVSFGEWISLGFTMSHNFFDMDNMGPSQVIMTFADAETNGLKAVTMEYDRDQQRIFFGSTASIQTGGAVLHESSVDLRVLNREMFAVFYKDDAIQSLMLVMCAITESNDIAVVSPNYVVSRPRGFMGRTEYYYDLCEIDMGDFAIVEYQSTERERTVMIHRGDVRPRPFGIVSKVNKNSLMVQFAGMFQMPRGMNIIPGRAVLTNSYGDLVEGDPFGYENSNFGNFYVESRKDNSILSGNNLIGIAVTKRKIYMKINCPVCSSHGRIWGIVGSTKEHSFFLDARVPQLPVASEVRQAEDSPDGVRHDGGGGVPELEGNIGFTL